MKQYYAILVAGDTDILYGSLYFQYGKWEQNLGEYRAKMIARSRDSFSTAGQAYDFAAYYKHNFNDGLWVSFNPSESP